MQVVLATFVSATRPAGSVGATSRTSMHKFFTDAPEALFADFAAGAGGSVTVTTIGEVAARFRRTTIIDAADA